MLVVTSKLVGSEVPPDRAIAEKLYNAIDSPGLCSIQDIIPKNVPSIHARHSHLYYYALGSDESMGNVIITSDQLIIVNWRENNLQVSVFDPTPQTLINIAPFADRLVIYDEGRKARTGKSAANFVRGFIDGYMGKPPQQ